MKYVVGFLFDESVNNVALIKKIKPKWQNGLLNGIGGKIEDGETPLEAIVRELYEESGAKTSKESLTHFCNMSGTNNDGSDFEIDFFFGYYNLNSLITKTEEQIEIHCVEDVRKLKTIGNITWLVALAEDFLKGNYPPKFVTVKY